MATRLVRGDDVRVALRRIGRAPGHLVAAALTLSLGLATTVAAFSVLDPLLFRTLPVVDPHRLVLVHSTGPLETIDISPIGALARYAAEGDVFDAVIADAGRGVVSANYFTALGITAVLGRMPTPEDVERRPDVVVISHGDWRRTHGGDPTVIGRTIAIDGRPHTIVAVAPREFFGVTVGASPDVYRPIAAADNPPAWVRIVGRLRAGVTLADARARLEPSFRAMVEATDLSAVERDQVMRRLVVTPAARGLSDLRTRVGGAAMLVGAVIALVWIVACANVANLTITRGVGRTHEIAVRQSLGASRAQAASPLVVEGLIVVAVAVAASLVVAPWMSGVLLAGLAGNAPDLFLSPPASARLAAMWITISGLTAVAAVLPAALAARGVPGAAAALAGRAHVGGRPSAAQRLLIAGQVALSVALVAIAGLLVHSLVRLHTTDIGYDRHRVLAVSLTDTRAGRRAAGEFDRSIAAIAAALGAHPGVAATAVSAIAPFGGSEIGINVSAAGAGGNSVHSYFSSVSAGYFETLGVPVRAGRGCEAADAAGRPVAILNARLAAALFGERDPIGREIRFVQGSRPPMQVVGVATDAIYNDVRETPRRFLYLCRDQQPAARGARATLFVRARGADAAALGRDVERALAEAGSGIQAVHTDTIAGAVRTTLARERVTTALLSTFALATLMLAAIGIYGVLAASVARRSREIGVRAALGADRWQIARAIVAMPAVLTGAGLLSGVTIAVAAARLIRAHLFFVAPFDPAALAATAAAVVLATTVACVMPVRRAWRVDPATALRRD